MNYILAQTLLSHIKEVKVQITDNGCDIIYIVTDFPLPEWPYNKNGPTSFTTSCARGKGVQWVKDNFGIEPTVIGSSF